MKKIVVCDNYYRHITEHDYEILKGVSPGLSRLVKDSDSPTPTHFVCQNCGQIAPIKLQPLHQCAEFMPKES